MMTEVLRATHSTAVDALSFLDVPAISSPNTALIRQALVAAASPSVVAQQITVQAAPAKSLEERLYDARAWCKIKTASVAMHLDREWQTRFFAQLDNLMSLESWEPDDLPVTGPSFETLIRMLVLIGPGRRPGLGAACDGHIIATWTVEKDRLTIECLPHDYVHWVVSSYLDGVRESAAGRTLLCRLQEVLQPYNPQRWFVDEGR